MNCRVKASDPSGSHALICTEIVLFIIFNNDLVNCSAANVLKKFSNNSNTIPSDKT